MESGYKMKSIIKSYKLFFFISLLLFSGNLFSQEIFITKLTDLDFGDVFIGTANVDLPYTDANAATFSFYHTSDAGGKKGPFPALNVSFVLPDNLVFGANDLPITFDQTHSAWHDVDQVGAATNFDPWAGFQTGEIKKYDAKKNKNVIYVWLGANVPATAGYPSGLYTGTIEITVDFVP